MNLRLIFDRASRALPLPLALAAALIVASCSKKGTDAPGLPARSYLMGFTAVPPRNDFAQLLAALRMWNSRADAAMFFSEPPWDSMLAGVRPDSLVMRNQLALANYYHGTGKKLVVLIDPENGLNRGSDSDLLVAASRSITEPAIRQLFYRYAVAMDTLLHPDYFGASAETNLIRAAAPAALYQAVVTIADTCTRMVRAVDPTVRLLSTVQVDVAWGHLGGPGTYVGVAQDRADFPFMQVLGLSSYPYFAYVLPESLPADYYSRLVEGSPIPEMVIEGGWTSASLPSNSITSSPEIQRRYIVKQTEMLDRAQAIGWFQITFTDLDLTGVVLPPGSILPLFAALGLVDANLVPKPALTPWDAAFARPKR
jgi:hypothetical protein